MLRRQLGSSIWSVRAPIGVDAGKEDEATNPGLGSASGKRRSPVAVGAHEIFGRPSPTGKTSQVNNNVGSRWWRAVPSNTRHGMAAPFKKRDQCRPHEAR